MTLVGLLQAVGIGVLVWLAVRRMQSWDCKDGGKQ